MEIPTSFNKKYLEQKIVKSTDVSKLDTKLVQIENIQIAQQEEIRP